MIVIACNTASACSIDLVKHSFDIPVVEVVEAWGSWCPSGNG